MLTRCPQVFGSQTTGTSAGATWPDLQSPYILSKNALLRTRPGSSCGAGTAVRPRDMPSATDQGWSRSAVAPPCSCRAVRLPPACGCRRARSGRRRRSRPRHPDRRAQDRRSRPRRSVASAKQQRQSPAQPRHRQPITTPRRRSDRLPGGAARRCRYRGGASDARDWSAAPTPARVGNRSTRRFR